MREYSGRHCEDIGIIIADDLDGRFRGRAACLRRSDKLCAAISLFFWTNDVNYAGKQLVFLTFGL